MADKMIAIADAERARIRTAVEQQWLRRAEAQDYKRSTRKYAIAEAEYFCGAMAALNAAFPAEKEDQMSGVVPPIWVINMLSGRNVVEVK